MTFWWNPRRGGVVASPKPLWKDIDPCAKGCGGSGSNCPPCLTWKVTGYPKCDPTGTGFDLDMSCVLSGRATLDSPDSSSSWYGYTPCIKSEEESNNSSSSGFGGPCPIATEAVKFLAVCSGGIWYITIDYNAGLMDWTWVWTAGSGCLASGSYTIPTQGYCSYGECPPLEITLDVSCDGGSVESQSKRSHSKIELSGTDLRRFQRCQACPFFSKEGGLTWCSKHDDNHSAKFNCSQSKHIRWKARLTLARPTCDPWKEL